MVMASSTYFLSIKRGQYSIFGVHVFKAAFPRTVQELFGDQT